MVRRWSFIGCTNNLLHRRYVALQHYLVDSNVNSVMYLRKTHSFFTRTRRRSWARRKHLYNWLNVANIFKFWAKRYRVYRNTHKFLQNIFSSQHSFLTCNVYFTQHKLLHTLRQSSELTISSTTKSLFRRDYSHSLWSPLSLLSYNYVSPLFISVRSLVLSPSTLHVLNSIGSFSYFRTNSLFVTSELFCGSSSISDVSISVVLFSSWITQLKLLYRSCVLLLLLNLNLFWH